MDFLQDFVADVRLPPMYRMRQLFADEHLADVADVVEAQLCGVLSPSDIACQAVGIALGSRGIAGIAEIAHAVVSWVAAGGGNPFIIPAMGSHGGATPEGQRAVLAHLGITETSVGAPIRSAMTVRVLGQLFDHPVYWCEEALHADRLILINRVKPHTAFRGDCESGLTKMVTIGLGKRHGAETLHGLGPERFATTIPAFAATIQRHAPPITGLALVENAQHRICHVEAVRGEDFAQREPALLAMARQKMARFHIDRFDVLVVNQIGKNVSGDGMDPNITGRYPVSHLTGGATINKIVVLGLTPETNGNGNGIGLADITTHQVLDSIDWDLTYVNALSGMTTTTIRRPFAAGSVQEAVKLAIKTATADPEHVELIRIRNTLEMTDILVSERLVEPLLATGKASLSGGPVDWGT